MDESSIFSLLESFSSCGDEERQEGESALESIYPNPGAGAALFHVLLAAGENEPVQYYGIAALKRWWYIVKNSISDEEKHSLFQEIDPTSFFGWRVFPVFINFFETYIKSIEISEFIDEKVAQIIQVFDQTQDESIVFVTQIMSVYIRYYIKYGIKNEAQNEIMNRFNSLINIEHMDTETGCVLIQNALEVILKDLQYTFNSRMINEETNGTISELCEFLIAIYGHFLELTDYCSELTHMLIACLNISKFFVQTDLVPEGWCDAVADVSWAVARKCYFEAGLPNLAAQFLSFMKGLSMRVHFNVEIFGDLINMMVLTESDFDDYREQPSLFIVYAYAYSLDNMCSTRSMSICFAFSVFQTYSGEEMLQIVQNIPSSENGILLATAAAKTLSEKIGEEEFQEPISALCKYFVSQLATKTSEDIFFHSSFINLATKMLPILLHFIGEKALVFVKYVKLFIKYDDYVVQAMAAKFFIALYKIKPDMNFDDIIEDVASSALNYSSKYSLKFLEKIGNERPDVLEALAPYFEKFVEAAKGNLSNGGYDLYECISFLSALLRGTFDKITEEQYATYFELFTTLLSSEDKDFIGNAFNLSETALSVAPTMEFIGAILEGYSSYDVIRTTFSSETCYSMIQVLGMIIENGSTQEVFDLFVSSLSADFVTDTERNSVYLLLIACSRLDLSVNVESLLPVLESYPELPIGFNNENKNFNELVFAELIASLILFREATIENDSLIQRWIDAISLCAFQTSEDLEIQFHALEAADNEERHSAFQPLMEKMSSEPEAFINENALGIYKSEYMKMHQCYIE